MHEWDRESIPELLSIILPGIRHGVVRNVNCRLPSILQAAKRSRNERCSKHADVLRGSMLGDIINMFAKERLHAEYDHRWDDQEKRHLHFANDINVALREISDSTDNLTSA